MAQLDVRVYRVRDPFRFFAGLADPHQFGTDAPLEAPQERSWIERLTDWKRRQRSRIRTVLRRTQTGGRAFFPAREEELPTVHELVASDVQLRYLIN